MCSEMSNSTVGHSISWGQNGDIIPTNPSVLLVRGKLSSLAFSAGNPHTSHFGKKGGERWTGSLNGTMCQRYWMCWVYKWEVEIVVLIQKTGKKEEDLILSRRKIPLTVSNMRKQK